MSSALSGIKIAVLGGDARDLVLAEQLIRMGAVVVTVGLPRTRTGRAVMLERVEDACREAEVLILPMAGTTEQGVIRTVHSDRELIISEAALAAAAPDALLITGSARPFLREMAQRHGLHVLEIAGMDEVAILNAIPTAEGAVQLAMEQCDITIHSSHCAVLGGGRVGQTLARTLRGLEAQVTVVSREAAERARAVALGGTGCGFDRLPELMRTVDIVFNTVPSPVLERTVLKYANPEVLIIDLASHPGGVDFAAASEFGLKALTALSLPGKVAPLSAGRILANIVPRLIIEQMRGDISYYSHDNK
ncbi:MAG: dipicolinate synthase subunit DpsA [Syntrophomonadaceae bacterium]|nr:dipicolinate synthase subunit DpsA [Syntrophomonadaceae bacterium]